MSSKVQGNVKPAYVLECGGREEESEHTREGRVGNRLGEGWKIERKKVRKGKGRDGEKNVKRVKRGIHH